MQMVYSSPASFDAWETLGNANWNWKAMLPYLRKFHTHHPPLPGDSSNALLAIAKIDEAIASSEGPIQTSYSETGPFDKAWYEAWKSILEGLGYEGDEVGAGAQPSSIDPKTKTRSFAGSAYYSTNISGRKNLRVVTEAVVEKVVLEKHRGEVVASGVQFSPKSGERITVQVNKEVILSAGTMKSPQILELSGIGDVKLLKQHGIEVVVDSPNVGENFQDHQCVMVSFEVTDGVMTGEMLKRDPNIMPALLEMYQKDRSGPLGHMFVPFAQFRLPETFGSDGQKFIPDLLKTVSVSDPNETEAGKLRDTVTADLLSKATVQYGLAKMQFNISGHGRLSDMLNAEQEGNYVTILTTLNYPFSRGNIHITSSSATDQPLIDPKYLSHPMDLELLARHIQFLSTLTSTAPLTDFLKPSGRRIPNHAFVDGNDMDLDTAKEVAKEQMISNYHPAGTCGMGLRENGGVVDERLRVYGVRGLRVVDASVFPVLPRGNIISSVYAVAERAADLIKEDWRGR